MDNKQITEIQYAYMARMQEIIREKEQVLHRPLTYHIETFGCQMNAKDSEKLAGILEEIGYREEEKEEAADLVLYNTCTVRENANDKVYGRLGMLNDWRKRKNPNLQIVLCGCMMQEPDEIERMKKSFRFVSIIFGTHNIFQLAELLYRYETTRKQVIEVWDQSDWIVENLPVKRKYGFKCGINIMFGCNNFCSYCIVPYVRGRERSREVSDILREVTEVSQNGVKEIMLLGQNVNSYGKTLAAPVSFAALLKEVEKVEGIERIRFMTSHPKDLSPELIETMKESSKICHHFHLPLQSGSDRILAAMNRHYTKERYLSLAMSLREAVPDISITTDIIVGFPGETEEDFNETLDVVRQVRFDSAFTFIYSKRTGTPAAAMENQVPEDVCQERFNRLLKLVQEISAEKAAEKKGKILPVLFESVNAQDPTMITGKLSDNTTVHAVGPKELIGTTRSVRLDICKGFYYIGTIV